MTGFLVAFCWWVGLAAVTFTGGLLFLVGVLEAWERYQGRHAASDCEPESVVLDWPDRLLAEIHALPTVRQPVPDDPDDWGWD